MDFKVESVWCKHFVDCYEFSNVSGGAFIRANGKTFTFVTFEISGEWDNQELRWKSSRVFNNEKLIMSHFEYDGNTEVYHYSDEMSSERVARLYSENKNRFKSIYGVDFEDIKAQVSKAIMNMAKETKASVFEPIPREQKMWLNMFDENVGETMTLVNIASSENILFFEESILFRTENGFGKYHLFDHLSSKVETTSICKNILFKEKDEVTISFVPFGSAEPKASVKGGFLEIVPLRFLWGTKKRAVTERLLPLFFCRAFKHLRSL